VVLVGKTFGGSAADYEELVRSGLRAQLAVQSLVTGQVRVDLDFRPGTPAQLSGTSTDIPEIPAVPSDLNQLRNQLTGLPLRDLAETAQQALISLSRLSDRLDGMVDPLGKSALRVGDAATQTLQSTQGAVRQMQAEASTALRDLDLLLVDARRQLQARGGELSHTLAATDRTVHEAETLLGSVNDLVEPHSRFRGDLEATVHDLAASASSLKGFAQTVERNPNALLMGRASR
jgi:paraquat-inducible protein B